MSTGTKRDYKTARTDAEYFQSLFFGTYERWEVAGSVRRRKPEVGDVEHVVIPKWESLPADDLFATPEPANLLLRRCDQLMLEGKIARHVYGNDQRGAPKYRWGERNRGCEFRNFNHEIFTADFDNWGSKLAICTGPADFSRQLVTDIRASGHRNYKGMVWRCSTCPSVDERGLCEPDCQWCEGSGLKPENPVPVLTEKFFFELASMDWLEPEARR